MSDARFEDAEERPLRLKALDRDDLAVISSMAQDAVLPVTEMSFRRGERRFALFLNRFRWEDTDQAERHGRPFERVQALLAIEGVGAVSVQGIDRSDRDVVLSLLAVDFEPGEDAAGRVVLTFAGDGAVACEVEALEVILQDVTRPYIAPSGSRPEHPE